MNRSVPLTLAALFTFSVTAQNTPQVDLVPWADGLPGITDITHAHAGDDRLYVTLQPGMIHIVTDSMDVEATPFLDITDRVLSEGGEQGLLGLAFDPGYAENGFFYVNYIAGEGTGYTVISRFHAAGDVGDPDSEEILFTWPQPFTNHNGGDLAFGPDGLLYIPLGDGGDAGDPLGNAQDLTDPLGDIIRLDVSDADTTYTIPMDNPYVDATGDTLPEIWASGLRNPYRLSFDRENGDLWLGDVGQSAWEEVDHVPAGTAGGLNFGWRCYEGTAPFNTTGCEAEEMYHQPAAVHINDGQGGEWCAIIGGHVYRGAQWPHLTGHYIYTDFCKPQIWGLMMMGEDDYMDHLLFEDTAMTGWQVIGDDAMGELFVGNGEPGEIWKIVDKCPMDAPDLTAEGDQLTVSMGADSTFHWYMDGQVIPDEHEASYTATQTGMYHVVAVYTNGCALSSDTVLVTITGIGEATLPQLNMRPNPALDHVFLDWARTADVELVRVVDTQGRTTHAIPTPTSTRTVIDVRSFANGHYTVQLLGRSGAVLAAQRLVVAH